MAFGAVLAAVVLFGIAVWQMGLLNFVVSAPVVIDTPVVRTSGLTFLPAALSVRAGETVTLQLENGDLFGHSFDIDALDVHVDLPAQAKTAVSFTPTKPGTYLVYCAVPGHQEGGMVGELVVTP